MGLENKDTVDPLVIWLHHYCCVRYNPYHRLAEILKIVFTLRRYVFTLFFKFITETDDDIVVDGNKKANISRWTLIYHDQQ